jgi:hypothetical protein
MSSTDLGIVILWVTTWIYCIAQWAANRVPADEAPKPPQDTTEPMLLAAYAQAAESMRHYATLRFAQLTVLLAVASAFAGLLTSSTPLGSQERVVLRIIAMLATFMFLVMQERAVDHWKSSERSARAIEQRLGARVFLNWRQRSVVSATNATRLLHLLIGAVWLVLR